MNMLEWVEYYLGQEAARANEHLKQIFFCQYYFSFAFEVTDLHLGFNFFLVQPFFYVIRRFHQLMTFMCWHIISTKHFQWHNKGPHTIKITHTLSSLLCSPEIFFCVPPFFLLFHTHTVLLRQNNSDLHSQFTHLMFVCLYLRNYLPSFFFLSHFFCLNAFLLRFSPLLMHQRYIWKILH